MEGRGVVVQNSTVDGRIRAAERYTECGGRHPVGTHYLPPDCWTGTDNKMILIDIGCKHSQGAVTWGVRERGRRISHSRVTTVMRKDLIETRHQVLAPIGHLVKNRQVFIYSGVIKATDKEAAIVSCQMQLAAKMPSTGSRGVQIAN